MLKSAAASDEASKSAFVMGISWLFIFVLIVVNVKFMIAVGAVVGRLKCAGPAYRCQPAQRVQQRYQSRLQYAKVRCLANPGVRITACAPSLAAEVNTDDWLYAGIALANSECTSASTEVRPRIYRVVCANGAIAQEAEAEGFAIEKLQQPTVMAKIGSFVGLQQPFGKKLENAFDLAFRPERVEREAAIGRNASNAVIINPYEHLAHLVASGQLTEDERDLARRLFEQQGDQSLYGLSNAITAAAHRSRGDTQLRRSFGLEQLGGELARGEHGPPIGAPVYH